MERLVSPWILLLSYKSPSLLSTTYSSLHAENKFGQPFCSRYSIATSAGDNKPVILLVWFEISIELKLFELKVSFIIESTASFIFLALLNAVSITFLGVSGTISCYQCCLIPQMYFQCLPMPINKIYQ